MTEVSAVPLVNENHRHEEFNQMDGDYSRDSANFESSMEINESSNVIKEEPNNGSFEENMKNGAGNGHGPEKEQLKSPKKEDVSLGFIDLGYESDDDIPWAQRLAKAKQNGSGSEKKAKDKDREKEKNGKLKKKKKEDNDEDEEYKPEPKKKEKRKHKEESDNDYSEDDYKPAKKKQKKDKEKTKKTEVKKEKKTSSGGSQSQSQSQSQSPKKKKKPEDEEDVWEWWKEEKKPAGVKWNTLVHKGPLFAPLYEPLPSGIRMKYDGKSVDLSPATEEVATFYARMLDHEYTSKDIFNKNFFADWRKVMTSKEREMITDLKKCNFEKMAVYFKEQGEKRKEMTKEEKAKIKEQKDEEQKIYGMAIIDGHRQKIANFRIEPPGLFRGRGGHPKMGKLKKRIQPEDVIINCSKGGDVPQPPPGHKWKEVRHDNSVTWLCSWTESVLGSNKYIMLNPSSKIKGEKDYEKYETARRLKKRIGKIREAYQEDWKSKEMRVRQRSVALYFIDKLALRAGNEKDTDEAADTVGCCSLRVEHIKLHDEHDGKEYVVEFDFLGKDSIRYHNFVHVEKRVYKNLKIFMENKNGSDDLFDRLDTAMLNEHLRQLMDGLTAKVFRTYNASITLQEQLAKLTNPDENVHHKMLSYNRANRRVAELCNHQRAYKEKKKEVKEAKREKKDAKSGTAAHEKAKKKYLRLKEQLEKIETQMKDKDENKQIALGTSKLNYLDPRISIAWCKKFNVPVEKVFNRTQRDKFRWAIDMIMNDEDGDSYEF
ncbi:hypothetical protein WR25_22946 [Diploscapter pachys]|uniref:DNA topoisomerase I n=1 Tax=Diploscapter pachys TaxID=2018661 RepID=A0A2A2LC22_9BILA|nr:hypothetical protein WR25_22946 [Diploscapter pachys]